MAPSLIISIVNAMRFLAGSHGLIDSIEGTIGYVDPEYLEALHVTTLNVAEKCDVHGFGVVLVEVLIGDYPTETFLGYMNLVGYFVLSMEENCILQIIDDVVLSQGSNEDIQAFAELALKCIKKKGDERLAMREVTLELRRIQHLTWSNKIMKLVQLKHR
uniref:Protein kinase domain-containing protein n=1 Tax=Quercus lobata TaxID=97700 RepID=A0A7N2LA32_QUELO